MKTIEQAQYEQKSAALSEFNASKELRAKAMPIQEGKDGDIPWWAMCIGCVMCDTTEE